MLSHPLLWKVPLPLVLKDFSIFRTVDELQLERKWAETGMQNLAFPAESTLELHLVVCKFRHHVKPE